MPTATFSLDFAKVVIGIFSYRFSRKNFNELGLVPKSSKQISLQFKTSLNSLRPSISEFRSNQNEQKRNGVTDLRVDSSRSDQATFAGIKTLYNGHLF
jgi:hypothetical protein